VATNKNKNKTKSSEPSNSPRQTQTALDDLDRVFHEKARLGIMTTIVGGDDGLNFVELKELCGLTDGNLNRHLKVLVDTGVLKVLKTGQGRNTNSQYQITASGRRAFERYLAALETILNTARQSSLANRPNLGDRKRPNDGLSPATG
jgi:DNA-binding HxlR family transcriptional regulator